MLGIELIDLTTVHPHAQGFSGAVGDGRFIYLIPLNNGNFHGRVLRFDSQGTFTDRASWTSFDAALVYPDSRGFVHALYDGRYVYLVPYCHGRHHGQVTRYDTQSSFTDPTSWQIFDTTQLDPHCRGYVSGTFDGRYLYLAPYQLDWATTHGWVTRYDTSAAFADPAAWSIFNVATVLPLARGFHSAITSGNYVYFVPYLGGEQQYSGLLIRYDRRQSFVDPASWQAFDLTSLNPGCRGYVGGTVHDNYLYLSPYMDGQNRHGRVVRFDTRQPLADPAAWSVFDCATVDPGSRGFFGAICDAHHLYLVPHCRGVNEYHGQLTRYDLRRDFNDRASWEICDLSRAASVCRGFIGGLIHLGYLYLPPFETAAGCHSGWATRVKLDQLVF